MNAVTPIEPSYLIADDSWDATYRAANEWRGEFIYHYAKGEKAISEILLDFASLEEGTDKGLLPSQISQRLARLSGMLEQRPAKVFKIAAEQLVTFRAHEELRHHLCHGSPRVARLQSGKWLMHIELLSFQKGKASRTDKIIYESDAEKLLAEIKQHGRNLSSALGQVRKQLRDQSASSGTS